MIVEDLERNRYFQRHPWILEAGGLELVEQIEGRSVERVASYTSRIGYFGDSHSDEVFLVPGIGKFRTKAHELFAWPFHSGQQVRNWSVSGSDMALIPYSNNMEPLKESELTDEFMIYAWPYRAELWSRINFNGKTYRNAGRSWWEWHQLPRDASAHKWSIAFTDLATHNHFSLERDRVAFNRHAPIIKLKSDVADEIHLGLLGVLNSSTACFWLKQVSQNRGSTVDGQGARQITIPWENFYDFTGANIQELPLAPNLPVEAGGSWTGSPDN